MEEHPDQLLVQRELVTTRARAEKIIKEIGVRVDGKLITKIGTKVPIDSTVEIIKE